MKEITKAEMDVVLALVKSPEVIYNANSLSKVIGITPMGTLKILKRLEQESIVKSKKIGKAITYKVNVEDPYAHQYVSLILAREAHYANPQIKRWIHEIKRIKGAEVIVLFGSVLEKSNPNDIDVLLVTDQKRFPKLHQEIEELRVMNIKKIHPMYQTYGDIIKNIKKRDKPLLNAIKGIVVLGQEKFMEIYNESRKE
ncbi:TPA: hypothetical protein HA242_05155 [Candidatus Woesearchaeota archaeon]|nr:hypothetical protein [Candidatus Woesearchaeota archaeon]HIG93296.1 hypothetical protein [Candidatus Woesearchaeota archaeon]HIH13088.1 hypothetical protein [Candidatus Woesearchaeota archaeon]